MESRTKILQSIAKAKAAALERGAVLIIDEGRLHADEHLNCFWYGGHIATVKHKNGWAVDISVTGDVSIQVEIDGTEYEYCDKSNRGAYGQDIAEFINSSRGYPDLYRSGRNRLPYIILGQFV